MNKEIAKLLADDKALRTVLIITAVVLGLVVISKTAEAFNGVLEGLGIKDSDEDIKKKVGQEKGQTRVIDAVSQDLRVSLKKMPLSFSESVYINAANVIQSATENAWDDNKTAVKAFLNTCKNQSDYLKLVAIFGSREHTKFFIAYKARTLPELMTQELRSYEKTPVNKTMTLRKINAQF